MIKTLTREVHPTFINWRKMTLTEQMLFELKAGREGGGKHIEKRERRRAHCRQRTVSAEAPKLGV